MQASILSPQQLEPATRAFYARALALLNEATIPYLVGGAYALGHYIRIARHTKDLDVFVRREDCRRVLDAFDSAGYATELAFSHWLGKVFSSDDLIDIIFSSGNGLCEVDEAWFEHAVPGRLFDVPILFCAPEEIIWQKAFIMERKRFDGADVLHLLQACGPDLDWPRLLQRFGAHWRVLLSHLILFDFVYPEERGNIPAEVMNELLSRAGEERTPNRSQTPLCQGSLLSLLEYLVDIEERGYGDARLRPQGNMTRKEIVYWTSAFLNK